jgi:hypothetical protein
MEIWWWFVFGLCERESGEDRTWEREILWESEIGSNDSSLKAEKAGLIRHY